MTCYRCGGGVLNVIFIILLVSSTLKCALNARNDEVRGPASKASSPAKASANKREPLPLVELNRQQLNTTLIGTYMYLAITNNLIRSPDLAPIQPPAS